MMKRKSERMLALALAVSMAFGGASTLATAKTRSAKPAEPKVIVSTGDLEVPANGKIRARVVNVAAEDIQSVSLCAYTIIDGKVLLAEEGTVEGKLHPRALQRDASAALKSSYEFNLADQQINPDKDYVVVARMVDGKECQSVVKIGPKAK